MTVMTQGTERELDLALISSTTTVVGSEKQSMR